MRKLLLTIFCMSLCACSTVPEQREQQKQLVKTVAATVVVIAIAGAVGKSQHASKCQNNRAGFYQDHSTGKIYTC